MSDFNSPPCGFASGAARRLRQSDLSAQMHQAACFWHPWLAFAKSSSKYDPLAAQLSAHIFTGLAFEVGSKKFLMA